MQNNSPPTAPQLPAPPGSFPWQSIIVGILTTLVPLIIRWLSSPAAPPDEQNRNPPT